MPHQSVVATSMAAPAKQIEGCHKFSTLSVCHLLLHPIALGSWTCNFDARLHMKLWIHWPRVEKMLSIARIQSQAWRAVRRAGLSSRLELAGICGRMGPAIPCDPSPPPVEREPLPADVAALRHVSRSWNAKPLGARKSVQLTKELDIAKDELAEFRPSEPLRPPGEA